MSRISGVLAVAIAATIATTAAQAQKVKIDPIAYTDQKVAEEAAIRGAADSLLSTAQTELRADVNALQQNAASNTPAAAYVVDANGAKVGPVVPVHARPVYTVGNDFDSYRVAALLRAGEDRIKVLFNYTSDTGDWGGAAAAGNPLAVRSPFRVYYQNFTCTGVIAYVMWNGSDDYSLTMGGAGDVEFDGYSPAFLLPTDTSGQSFVIARFRDDPRQTFYELPAYRTPAGECRPNSLQDRYNKEYAKVGLFTPATAFNGPFRIR